MPRKRLVHAMLTVVAAAGALAACAGHTRPAEAVPGSNGPSVTIVDLTPRFLAFYDSAVARPLDADARYTLWKRLYGFAAVPPTPFGDTLAHRLLAAAWSRYPDSLPRIRRGVAALGLDPTIALRRVVDVLGCGEHTHVQVVAFVGGFEQNAFTYSTPQGVPSIALPVETGDAERPMYHEFTHAVHRGPQCADIRTGYGQSLAQLALTEGLAMHVVERLLPGHPAAWYIHATQGWLDSANARRAVILDGVREHMADSGNATAQRFVMGGGTTGMHREAYYAGWTIVAALLRDGTSLHAIATTRADDIPALVRHGIDAELRADGR